MTILLALTVMSCLSSMMRLLLSVEDNFENDVSRYINEQRASSAAAVMPNLRNQKQKNVALQTTQTNKTVRESQISDMKRKHVSLPLDIPTTTTTTTTTNNTTIGFHDVSSDINIDDTNRQQKQQERSNQILDYQNNSGIYWNLSCPLELSMFSGAHMGGDFHARAEKARAIAAEALERFGDIDWKLLENRRIFFVGDSLLRQVFISMACLSWDRVSNYAIPWFEKRGVRMRQPNTIGSGSHSKFEEGRVLLEGNIELVYHHGIGGLLELGDEYESHDPNTWIKSCFLRKPFTTMTPKFPRNHEQQLKISTENVEREQLTLKDSDIVLINASVHAGRSFNLHNIVDLFNCKSMMTYPGSFWPRMLYIATGPSHFPTETGAFDKELLDMDEDYNCIMKSSFHGYQDDEIKSLDGVLPIVGRDILPFEYESGDLHVGGKDCLHWLQPGIPDLVSQHVMDSILPTIEGSKQVRQGADPIR
jgi:hypothetical protein